MSVLKPGRTKSPRKSLPVCRSLRLEALEDREVLSADLSVGVAAPPASFDLAIRGTEIQYSPLGLPAYMAGDVYLSAADGASPAPIGHYQEALSPILMDINGDQVPDFVGTTGVATFSFFVNGPHWSIGSFTTENVSFIQAALPTGQLVVGSQGAIVDSSQLLSGAEGGFVSQSVVTLAPSFEMQTNVHVTLTAGQPIAGAMTVLAMVNAHDAALATAGENGWLHRAEKIFTDRPGTSPALLDPKFVDQVLEAKEKAFQREDRSSGHEHSESVDGGHEDWTVSHKLKTLSQSKSRC